uniref:Galectin n=1 Tax=Mesocestoides corti TaxID=53468 RepID=A0A5K3G3A8_MESCO
MDFKFSAIAPGVNPGKVENGSFHSMYFPYRGQLAYLQPLVFVMFDGVKRNTFIRVRCWLIAKNIKVDFARGEGSAEFEIMFE